jgi:peptide/nickel transport system permease protein
MYRYVVRRLLTMVPTFLIVSLVVFGMVRFLPGDVVSALAENFQYAESADRMRETLGLNRAIHSQYFEWLGGVFTGDLGRSLWTREPVVKELAGRLPVTLELALLAMIVNLCIGIPIGLLAAVRQDSWVDYVTRSIAIAGLAIPSFWLGTLIMTLPSVWANWTPPLIYRSFLDDPLANLASLIIPAMVLGLSFQGRTMRMVRGMMLEVMRQDYIRTAWAKGLREWVVVWRHAAKNALIPVFTLLALEVPFLLGGTLIVERIFDLPGMGRYVLDVLERRDYVTVQSVVLVFAGIIMVLNLAVDLMYTWLDPRIQYR